MSTHTPVPDDLFIGAGRLYFDRFTTAGASTGLLFLGNADALSITPAEDELRKKYGSTEPSRGLLKQVNVRRSVILQATLSEWNKVNLALALMGELAEYTQAATPVVDEILSTTPVKGGSYQTLKRRITAATFKRGATAITAEVSVVSAESGLVWLADTAPLFDGASGNLTASYTPTAIVAGSGLPWIKAAKSSVIEGSMLYVPDPTVGPKWELRVWKASIRPAEDVQVISDDWGDLKLQAEVLIDTAGHPDEPYYRAMKIA